MQWIKEVERAKSIDELMTSRSIVERTDSPDYDMLDATIASALKKLLDRHAHFRRRVSVEEQRAQKYDRFFSGRQIAFLIYEHFRATGAYEAVEGLSDLFNIRLQNDNVQDFDVRWDQALLSAIETPTEMVLEGSNKVKIAGFCSVSDCIGIYDLKTTRDHGQSSYQRLKPSVRLHIDQTMRTRNFRARNETVERGAITKSRKGKTRHVGRKVGECYQWRAT